MTIDLESIHRENAILAVWHSPAIRAICEEVVRAREVHPAEKWKVGKSEAEARLIQSGVILKEASEVQEAALNHVAYGDDWNAAIVEAVQTAATCVRLLEGK